jgi:hypothetical protein
MKSAPVDFRGAHPPRDVRGRKRADIVELIEGAFHPRAHRAAVARSQRKGDRLEAAAVVAFDQRRDLLGHGMIAEVGRDIAQPDAVMAVAFAVPQRRGALRDQRADHVAPALKLEPAVGAVAQQHLRRHGDAACDQRRDFPADLRGARPVAEIQRRHRAVARRHCEIRLQR